MSENFTTVTEIKRSWKKVLDFVGGNVLLKKKNTGSSVCNYTENDEKICVSYMSLIFFCTTSEDYH